MRRPCSLPAPPQRCCRARSRAPPTLLDRCCRISLRAARSTSWLESSGPAAKTGRVRPTPRRGAPTILLGARSDRLLDRVRRKSGDGLFRGDRHELRRQIAVEHQRADVAQAAVEIRPDLPTDVRPALAKAEILAEIGAVRVDQAIEQRET